MLDDTDSLILDALRTNSRNTMKELGEKVHLSGPAASARVEKPEDAGVIEGFTIKVNPEKMGCPVHAFITIFTNSSYHTPYLNLVAAEAQYVVRNLRSVGTRAISSNAASLQTKCWMNSSSSWNPM